jgi:hypothetical protein
MEKLTAAAEIISAVGVLITLIILVLSVRENTATVRATAAAASRDALASMNDQDLLLTDDDIRLLVSSTHAETRWQDLDEVEQFKLKSAQRSFFRRAEAQYFRYRHGLLDDDAWQTVRHRVWLHIETPVQKAIWERDRLSIYTPGFVEAIESYQPPDRPGD